MKIKLLVIADLVHASPRMPGLLDSLADKNWEIIIVTPELPIDYKNFLGFPINFEEKVTVIQTKNPGSLFKSIRKLFVKSGYDTKNSILEQVKASSKSSFIKKVLNIFFRIFMELYAYPDLEKNWRKPGIKTCSEIIETVHPNVILSSSPFPTSHRVASFLKSEFKIPWVADYRDPWVGNPVYQYSSFREIFESRLEKKTVRAADCIITVSDAYAEVIHNLLAREVQVLPNGFIDYKELKFEKNSSSKLNLIHTGNLYFPQHNVRLLFEALQIGIKNNFFNSEDLKISFYGRIESHIQSLILEFKMGNIVSQEGAISRLESVIHQRQADGLLFFNWNSSMNSGLSHLKFYEYLNSMTPILVIGPGKNRYTEIISETEAGAVLESPEQIAEFIRSLKSGTLFENSNTNTRSELISEYSYRHLANGLEKILISALSKTDKN